MLGLRSVVLIFLAFCLACGPTITTSPVDSTTVILSLHELYLATYKNPEENLALAAKMRPLSIMEYYAYQLKEALDAPAIVSGYQIPNSRQTLLGMARHYQSLAARFPTVEKFWAVAKYNPAPTISEEQFRANLSSIFTSARFPRRSSLQLGAGFSLPFSSCQIAAPANQSIFYSGRTGVTDSSNNQTTNISAEVKAYDIAEAGGGMTIYQALKSRGIGPPDDWKTASAEFARCAKGRVLVVLGIDQKIGSVWSTVELPALQNNTSVTQIDYIDPAQVTDTYLNEIRSGHKNEFASALTD